MSIPTTIASATGHEFRLLIDRFLDDRPPGHVIGTATDAGFVRKGADKEGVVGIDNGALRIGQLIKPGWGRAGITYGPFRRESGLTFHALVLDGHTISQSEPLPDGLRMRLWRWAVGAETDKVPRRILQWLRSGQKKQMWRRLRQWIRSGTGLFYWPAIAENLAVGWFPAECPDQPQRQGCAWIVHAVLPEGGELWARTGAACAPTVRGVQGLPVYYTVVLREQGAAYYVSSPFGAPYLGEYPGMRLVAIDPFDAASSVHAGIHQSVLGEIGFRAETRVYGAQVARIPELSAWYGTAHGADSLTGGGPLVAAPAEVGGRWRVLEGDWTRSPRGASGVSAHNAAALNLDSPAGFVHLLIDCGGQPVEGAGVIWRAVDENNFWCFEAGSSGGRLSIVENGRWSRHAEVRGRLLPPNTVSSIQVFDDGASMRIHVNGSLMYGTTLHDARLRHGTGVGIRMAGQANPPAIRAFEAHPRSVRIPGLAEFGGPWPAPGGPVVVADGFAGPPGDLDGHITSVGGCQWRRDIGTGVFERTGHGAARVKASAQKPCPGRTAYMIDWPNPSFADIAAGITPAGLRAGTREKGRAGFIFWQDPDNYLTFSAFVEDWPAMSIAAFFRIGGFEELYDAVWTNVGSRMHWGERHDFRVVFDGQRFLASINEEPLLYRALTDVYPRCPDLSIRRVGMVANWEWGNDTGSTFENFVGRNCR